MKLSELKLNPDNPRNISELKLQKLAESIKAFPKMMVKRPIVYDKDRIIIGGNMRYRACEINGMMEIPDNWTMDASDFSDEERHRFIMQDNAEMGRMDWDLVANQYELEDLDAWGVELPYGIVQSNNPDEEWANMPEFNSENVDGVKHLVVHFLDWDDYKAFCELIGQDLSQKAKSTYYPKLIKGSQTDHVYE